MEGVLDDENQTAPASEPQAQMQEERKPRTPVLDPLSMKQCEYTDQHKSLYRVYVNATDYELAEASTAAEAIYNAKTKPYKVLRESKDNYYTLPRHKVAERADGSFLYSDIALTDFSQKKEFHNFDVSTYQPKEVDFEETDYTGLAGLKSYSSTAKNLGLDEIDYTKLSKEEEQASPIEEAQPEEQPQEPIAEETQVAQPEPQVVEENIEEPEPQQVVEKETAAAEPAEEDDALSPEEVAELLGDSSK